MKNQADYSKYECPYSYLKKECGHELKGPEGYQDAYGVWCACGFRGPAFYLDPEELNLRLKSPESSRLGRPLQVYIRPLLVTRGQLGCNQSGPVIMIDSDQSKEEQNLSLWHEVVHLLRDVGGWNQDENEVEDWALKLNIVCPEAIEWVSISD